MDCAYQQNSSELQARKLRTPAKSPARNPREQAHRISGITPHSAISAPGGTKSRGIPRRTYGRCMAGRLGRWMPSGCKYLVRLSAKLLTFRRGSMSVPRPVFVIGSGRCAANSRQSWRQTGMTADPTFDYTVMPEMLAGAGFSQFAIPAPCMKVKFTVWPLAKGPSPS
jgi:hypothetical protein